MNDKIKKLLYKLYCLISRKPYRNRNMYDHLKISENTIKKLQHYHITPIHLDDSDKYYRSYSYSKKSLFESKFKDHPAFKYFKYIDKFLFSADAPNSRTINREIRKRYWSSYNIKNKDKYINDFSYYVGYHEYISPNYDFKGFKKIGPNKYSNHVEKLNLFNRYEMPLHIYKIAPSEKSKRTEKVVIALNGILSTADNVAGLEEDDYTKSFGNRWAELGYTVYALQVSYCRPFINTYSLSLSTQGMDLSNILDLINFIKNNESDNKEIIVIGISHGGILAEMVGILSSDVTAVVTNSSLGSEDDSFSDAIFPAENSYSENDSFAYQPQFLALYKRSDLLKLLCPKKLVISVGAGDHGNEKYKVIFKVLEHYSNYNYSNQIGVNIFYGFHEPNPENEERILAELFRDYPNIP
ncbi:MAG: hypothetical protein CMD58_05735 [Gammaproteobacteria bacterium]|nr:hypothetical protein [Gammaproteobacteria bacterium]